MNLKHRLIAMPEISETERVQRQTNDEWRAEYDSARDKHYPASPQVVSLRPESSDNIVSRIPDNVKKAGIVSIKHISSKLLITTDTQITNELDSRIKKRIQFLQGIAEADTGESLYEYTGYRTTFVDKRPFLVLTFREIHTGALAERYFNISLKSKQGKSFKTGINGQFRVIGNIKRIQEGMFLKFWMDVVKDIPDNRPAHICRYMNSKLANAVISCSNPVPHHGFTKLTKLKYEGHLYQIN